MKRLFFLIIFSIMFILSGHINPKTNYKITVPGNRDWIYTGIVLKSSDSVTITAKGRVCFHNGVINSCIGANGWPQESYSQIFFYDSIVSDDPLPEEGHAGLIARIGSDIFFVGSKKTFSKKNGPLFLGINDCTFTGNYFNTGRFYVSIEIKQNSN